MGTTLSPPVPRFPSVQNELTARTRLALPRSFWYAKVLPYVVRVLPRTAQLFCWLIPLLTVSSSQLLELVPLYTLGQFMQIMVLSGGKGGQS